MHRGSIKQVMEQPQVNKSIGSIFIDHEIVITRTAFMIQLILNDRHGMWQMLRVYGVGGKFMKAVQSFYVDNKTCVQVGNDVSE